jgi:hypothetical protein
MRNGRPAATLEALPEPGSEAAAADLISRLRARLPVLTAGLVDRAYAIADPRDAADEIYRDRLPEALGALLEYGVTMIELGDRRDPGPPPAVLAEVRLAARSGVSLDTIVRRCLAASALLGDALVREAEDAGTSTEELRRLLALHATAFDRVLDAESAEYASEAASWPRSTMERRRECAKRLLAGEMVDGAILDYDLDATHLGAMAAGEGAEAAMRALASRLGRRLLAIQREEEPIWACWLGGSSGLDSAVVLAELAEIDPGGVAFAIGEPGEGLGGWRTTHRQAKAALSLARRRPTGPVRYADVVLEVALLHGDLAASTLRRVYLEPLEASRDGGAAAITTLRAYFEAQRNVSSTAAALAVDRRTVANRIRAIEDRFGRPLNEFAAEMETALRLFG